MWQRFTERSRRAVFFAQEEAGRLGTNYVHTEHLLLGVIREHDTLASRILDRLGVSPDRVRAEIEKKVELADGRLGADMQLTPRAKRVVDLAFDEARLLRNDYIGTEHLLMGLVREREGLAGRVLTTFGVGIEQLRAHVQALQDNDTSPSRSAAAGESRPDDQRAAEVVRRLNEDSNWNGRSLVSLADVSIDQIRSVLDAARLFKALDHNRTPGVTWNYPRTLAMIFEKPSLRTRVSFEAAMAHLGGHAIHLGPNDIGMGSRESASDVALALSRWVDVISARVFKHETVVELAAHATVPVINALSDREHPVQAFADLLTLEERKGPLGKGVKIAYIGDGNNVLHALLLACAKLGVHLSAACPEGYLPDQNYIDLASESARLTGSRIDIGTDPPVAAADADCVYTDVWTSMGQEDEQVARLAVFAPYQVNSVLMARAKPDAIVLHCLPAHCGEEISEEVYERHRDGIMDQAENRLHTQKALIALILGI